MNDKIEFKISYENMRKIISNYFKSQGSDVTVKISSFVDDDRFPGTVNTIISVSGNSNIAGVTLSSNKVLQMADLEEIVNDFLAQDGKELVSITNNARSYETIEGAYMAEHSVSRISHKEFTVTAKPMSKGKKM